MQQGFLDSTLARREQNLQVERYKFRDYGYGGNTSHGRQYVTRFLASAPDQESNTLVLGVKGQGSLCARDFMSKSPVDDNGYGTLNYNKHIEKHYYRNLGVNSVDLCLAVNTQNYPVNQGNYGPKGNYSAIVGGASSQISTGGTGSFVAAGMSHQVSGAYAFIGAGQTNTINGQYAAIIGGQSNQAYAEKSTILGGNQARAYINNSTSYGGAVTANGRQYGSLVHLTGYSGSWSGSGTIHLATSDWGYLGNYGDYYHLHVPTNVICVVQGTVSAVTTNGVMVKAWSFELVARNTGTVSLLGTPVLNTLCDTEPAETQSWTFSIDASNGNYKGVSFTANTGQSNVIWSLDAHVNNCHYM